MSHHDENREQFKAARDAGLKARHAKRLERWQNVDDWLVEYERRRDPNGTYSVPGRDPQKILNLKDAS